MVTSFSVFKYENMSTEENDFGWTFFKEMPSGIFDNGQQFQSSVSRKYPMWDYFWVVK